jgi:hypothetical protein
MGRQTKQVTIALLSTAIAVVGIAAMAGSAAAAPSSAVLGSRAAADHVPAGVQRENCVTARRRAKHHSRPAVCGVDYYYSWNNDTGSGTPCLTATYTETVSNWGSCRNKDEYFANDTPGAVRLYYSPDEEGAWVCVPASWQGSLEPYTFDNDKSGDTAGYGSPVYEDVASSTSDSGGCDNPDSP